MKAKQRMTHMVIGLMLSLTSLSSFSAGKRTDAVLGPTVSYGVTMGNFATMINTGVALLDGDLWVWSYVYTGVAGNGHVTSSPYSYTHPSRVDFFTQKGLEIVTTAQGAHHIIAIDHNGDVWGWGRNYNNEATGGICTPSGNANYMSTPCNVLSNKKVIKIVAGEYFSMALSADGKVFTWGQNVFGQIANGSTNAGRNNVYQIPQSAFSGEKIVNIGGGYESGFAITESGLTYVWGSDEFGAYGNGTNTKNVSLPVLLGSDVNTKFRGQIEYICSTNHATHFLTSNGEVWGMGSKTALGQNCTLSSGPASCRDANTGSTSNGMSTNTLFVMDNIKEMGCYYGTVAAVTQEGELYTWGTNYGILYHMIYGSRPVLRNEYRGDMCKVILGKDRLLYANTEGEFYGVGYADYSPGNVFGSDGYKLAQWDDYQMNQRAMSTWRSYYGSSYNDVLCAN